MPEKLFLVTWKWRDEKRMFLVREWNTHHNDNPETWTRRTANDVYNYVHTFVGNGGEIHVEEVRFGIQQTTMHGVVDSFDNLAELEEGV